MTVLKNKGMIIICMLAIALQFSYADRVFKYPRVQQEKDQWCWDACSQWIIGFHGTIVTQSEICQYGFTDGQVRNQWNYIYCASENGQLISNNVYGRGINWVIAHWGVPWKVKSGNGARYILSEAEFKNDIEMGHPFVVRYNWDDNSGHFVVAMGYQNQQCWLMNPWQNDGVQIYGYDWVYDNTSGPLKHHVWDYTLQTTRVDTIPELTTIFPASVPAVGEQISLKLTSKLNGRDVTNCTFFKVFTSGVSIDSATRTISWTQTAQGPTSLRFAREFGNARDTITKTFGITGNGNARASAPHISTKLAISNARHTLTVYVPRNNAPGTAVALFSAAGNRVFIHKFIGTGSHSVSLDGVALSKGMYLLKITNGNHISVNKFIL
jgi:hypothetical protein